jgi:hypothetical protein
MINNILTLVLCTTLFAACSSVPENKKLTAREIQSGGREGGGGTKIGNGGGACVCRENTSAHKIITASLLDFTQAQVKYKLHINYSKEQVDVQISKALAKIPNEYADFKNDILDEIQNLPKITSYVDGETQKLPYSSDFISYVCKQELGANCKYEQAAIFDDYTQTLNIAESIEKKFQPTDIAGFKIHEAVYKLDREKEQSLDPNSEFTKKFVALLFAKNSTVRDISKTLEEYFAPKFLVPEFVTCKSKDINVLVPEFSIFAKKESQKSLSPNEFYPITYVLNMNALGDIYKHDEKTRDLYKMNPLVSFSTKRKVYAEADNNIFMRIATFDTFYKKVIFNLDDLAKFRNGEFFETTTITKDIDEKFIGKTNYNCKRNTINILKQP